MGIRKNIVLSLKLEKNFLSSNYPIMVGENEQLY